MDRRRAFPALIALIGLLLPAGVLAATSVAPGATSDAQVGAAGFGVDGLFDERPTTTAAISSTTGVTVGAPSSSTPPTTRPATTTTTARRPGTTVATLVPGGPAPATTPATGIPNAPPASSWAGDGTGGVRARLRIEPAAPVAGQPVRFVIDISSPDPCCTILVGFGDGAGGWGLNNGRSCETSPPLAPGPLTVSTSHTYTKAGAYKVILSAFSGDSCQHRILNPEEGPGLPFVGAVNLTACIGVGPGSAAQAGCSPFPEFGPDSIISPVLDPFCQVRSDCTQASPPRTSG